MSKDVDTTFCLAVAASLSTSGPQSLYLFEKVSIGSLTEVIDYSIDYDTGVTDYRGATQIQALYKKNVDLELGYNPLKAGVEAFIKAELQCQEVNRYFGSSAPFLGVGQAISLARRKIANVLGPVPPLNRLKPRLGPGATTSIKRAQACLENKLARPIVCSEEMLPVVPKFLEETPGWARHHSDEWSRGLTSEANLITEEVYGKLNNIVVDVGTLTFVEKNAKTHRPICIEPVFNGFWQLGVGDYIKDRLRIHANQDLRDQERNRLLSREGSIYGNLATIDLSSASDTVAFSVVFDLLPEAWVDLLASLRTGHIIYDGYQLELEKFSSMGNGFTFELESLIFWALASACTELSGDDQNKVSVYGDDIIVPTRVVDLLISTLTWCGFSVNTEKSFWDGPFRESCGADWLNGEDVRPIFKKDRLSLQWLFTFHNWSIRRGEIALAEIARSLIPSDFQFFGPDGYGDGHLLGSYELITRRASRRAGWGGGYFSTFRETSRSTEIDMDGSFLYGLYDLYSRGPSSFWDPQERRIPGTTPGTSCVEKASIYTFAEHIFCSSNR